MEGGSSRGTVPGSGSQVRRDPHAKDAGVSPIRPVPVGVDSPRQGRSGTSRAGSAAPESKEDTVRAKRVQDADGLDEAMAKLGGLSLGEKDRAKGAETPVIGGGGAPIEGISTIVQPQNPAVSGPIRPSKPTDPHKSTPPPAAGVPEEAAALVSSAKTEKDWKAARPPSGGSSGSRAERDARWVRGGAPPPAGRNTRSGPGRQE
jgi:hypothetical protein